VFTNEKLADKIKIQKMNREFKKTLRYKEVFLRVIRDLKDLSISAYGNRLVALVIFGSVAKNTHTPESDIDLLIILKNKKSSSEEYDFYFDKIESRLKFPFPIVINPIFLSSDELTPQLSFLWDTEFLILFDRDNFFQKFLENLEAFKKKHIVIHQYPLEYIEYKNG